MAPLLHSLTRPLLAENPIMVQVLGLCSALAVSRSLEPALVMAVSVTAVLVVSNGLISLLRHVLPSSIRLVLEMTLIASAVIIVDAVLAAFLPQVSAVLTVFVGLIVTNCIILGRAEASAVHQGLAHSVADALGNGLGYSAVLLTIAGLRELLGAGTLHGTPVLPLVADGGWYRPVELMQLAPSAFFIVGFMVWGLRAAMARRQ